MKSRSDGAPDAPALALEPTPTAGSAAPRRRARSAKPPARGRIFTAQDVADFCEVDIKTIHHWSDAGKILHHRTEGRHLRFRRNHVVRFLRAHGYPLPDTLVDTKPLVFHAVTEPPVADEIARRLSGRFTVRRFPHGLAALAHLVDGAPDVLVLSEGDLSFGGLHAIAALKESEELSFPAVVFCVGASPEVFGPTSHPHAPDLVVLSQDVGRLGSDLARLLGLR